jgi:hypothetical protein
MKHLLGATFLNLAARADGQKSNQINTLNLGIEELKEIFLAG